MIVHCPDCAASFDDEFRTTICPHDTFAANDGHNNFAHHPDAHLSHPVRSSEIDPKYDRLLAYLLENVQTGVKIMLRDRTNTHIFDYDRGGKYIFFMAVLPKEAISRFPTQDSEPLNQGQENYESPTHKQN